MHFLNSPPFSASDSSSVRAPARPATIPTASAAECPASARPLPGEAGPPLTSSPELWSPQGGVFQAHCPDGLSVPFLHIKSV